MLYCADLSLEVVRVEAKVVSLAAGERPPGGAGAAGLGVQVRARHRELAARRAQPPRAVVLVGVAAGVARRGQLQRVPLLE